MQEVDVNDQVQSIEAVASEVISPPAPTMTLCSYGNKLTREELAQVRTPAGTATHKPIPHITVVEKLIEALSFRQIGVALEEYAVSSDGMKMFGVMDLSSGFEGCRFALGLRNSHDKTLRLSLSVGSGSLYAKISRFTGISSLSWPSIRNTSRWRTAWPLESTGCRETSDL